MMKIETSKRIKKYNIIHVTLDMNNGKQDLKEKPKRLLEGRAFDLSFASQMIVFQIHLKQESKLSVSSEFETTAFKLIG